MRVALRYIAAGFAAGAITGILGSGGGLILVPFLTVLCKEDSEMVFPSSLGIMLPICLCSLLAQRNQAAVPLSDVLPYLLGGGIGGEIACLHKNLLIFLIRRIAKIKFANLRKQRRN